MFDRLAVIMFGVVRAPKRRIEISHLFMSTERLVEGDGLEQQSAGFETCGCRRGIFELVPVERGGLAVKATLLQRVCGGAEVAQELCEDVGGAAVAAQCQFAVGGLAVFRTELLLKGRNVPGIDRAGTAGGGEVEVGIAKAEPRSRPRDSASRRAMQGQRIPQGLIHVRFQHLQQPRQFLVTRPRE
jgi:hypothetical protein